MKTWIVLIIKSWQSAGAPLINTFIASYAVTHKLFSQAPERSLASKRDFNKAQNPDVSGKVSSSL